MEGAWQVTQSKERTRQLLSNSERYLVFRKPDVSRHKKEIFVQRDGGTINSFNEGRAGFKCRH
jgi:glutamine cyclotransferase